MSLTPPTYSRRFGRTYHGLDNLSNASLCSRELGKVRADCRLRVSKSQWGRLGEPGNPAGIVYMDLSFDQPSTCRLASATVLITLEEVPEGNTLPRTLGTELQMTDYYGPKHLSGEATNVVVTKTLHLVPQVNVLGSGGGGVGVDSEKAVTFDSRWSFTGQLLPAAGTGVAYRTLKWELREDEMGALSNHSNVIHTGFAFQHDDRPFIMRVEIKGRLQSARDRIRGRLRFPAPHDKRQGSSETLVRPNGQLGLERPLDMLATGLSSAMEKENYMRIPVQIPDALPVSFSHEEEITPNNPLSNIDNTLPPGNGLEAKQIASRNNPATEYLSPSPAIGRLSSISDSSSMTLVDSPEVPSTANSSDPCIAGLGNAIQVFHHLPDGLQSSTSDKTASQSLDVSRKFPIEEADSIQDTIALLSQYPVLLLLVQTLAGILNLFYLDRAPRKFPGKDDGEQAQGPDTAHRDNPESIDRPCMKREGMDTTTTITA